MANFAGKVAERIGLKIASATGNVTARADSYGNIYTNEHLPPGQYNAAYDGSLFVARHAPLAGGSGVAIGITAAFVDTTPGLVLTNGEAAGGKTYLPLYIRLRCTAAGSTTTSSEVSVEVDNTNRYTSGGTSLTTTIASVTADAGAPASNATLVVGAITAAAAGARRKFVGSALVKVATAPVWVINDVLTIVFGGAASFVGSQTLIGAATATPTNMIQLPFAACAIPPQGSFVLNWANVANVTTAPSFEHEMAWIER